MRYMRSIMMPIPLVLLALLAGCATREVTFEKPGVSQTDRQQDVGICLREASGIPDASQVHLPYHLDRDVFVKCMEARGYTAQPK